MQTQCLIYLCWLISGKTRKIENQTKISGKTNKPVKKNDEDQKKKKEFYVANKILRKRKVDVFEEVYEDILVIYLKIRRKKTFRFCQ